MAELAITSGIELLTRGRPRGAFALPDVPGVAVVPARRRREVRPLLARPAGGRAADRRPTLCRRCKAAVEALPG